MGRKIFVAVIIGLLLVVGFGCSKKDQTAQNQNSQLPSGHPSVGDSQSGQPAKPIDKDEVVDKVTKDLNDKYPGDWSVSGTTLKKGSFTENGSYKIAEEVGNLYPGSMVSIFVGQSRISSTIKQNGKPVLEGYPTPPDVDKTMKSGQASVVPGSSMGSTSYQKVFIPLKSGDKTVAVMNVSIAQ